VKNVLRKAETNGSRETLIICAATKKYVAVGAPAAATRRLICVLSWGGMSGLLLSVTAFRVQVLLFSINHVYSTVPDAFWTARCLWYFDTTVRKEEKEMGKNRRRGRAEEMRREGRRVNVSREISGLLRVCSL
jgi:hypothetical protein